MPLCGMKPAKTVFCDQKIGDGDVAVRPASLSLEKTIVWRSQLTPVC